MRAEDVIAVLDALEGAGVSCWIGGGWGVVTPAGRQTREHRDLDLAVDAQDLLSCLAVLGDLGYVAETDWLPVRIELAAAGDRWVDVHPVSFAEAGAAVRRAWAERILITGLVLYLWVHRWAAGQLPVGGAATPVPHRL